jgi:hypothetical protein
MILEMSCCCSTNVVLYHSQTAYWRFLRYGTVFRKDSAISINEDTTLSSVQRRCGNFSAYHSFGIPRLHRGMPTPPPAHDYGACGSTLLLLTFDVLRARQTMIMRTQHLIAWSKALHLSRPKIIWTVTYVYYKP